MMRNARASIGIIAVGMTLTLALGAGCGPSGSGDDDDDDDDDDVVGAHLRIEPGDVTLTVEDGAAASQAYTVIAVDDAGGEEDVSDEASLSLGSPSLGTFDGSVLTTAPDRAGRTTVTAAWEGLTGQSDLTIVLRHVIVTPGAPANAPDLFDDATPGGASPELVYPQSGVIVPPNLNTIEFHYRPGAGNELFEITFTGTLVELAVYMVCAPLADGCFWEPDEETWELIATAARGETPLFYAVRGLDGGTVGVSETSSIQFSADDLLGGIYYWDAGAGAIKRYDFGRRGQSAEMFLGVGQTSAFTCVGCHTLSRDGSKIAVGLDIPAPAVLETYTVATKDRLWGTGEGGGFPGPNGANFFSFSPDATQLLASTGTSITLRNADDGSNMQTVVSTGTMPDWAPDGDRVVFARGTALPVANPGVSAGAIITVSATTWGDEQTLVPAGGANNYYPAYAPDSAWIAYNRSMLDDSFDATDARVWVVNEAGGTPIQLAAASPAPGGDSWPKWGPFIHGYEAGQVMWMTFSSRRAYGLRAGGTSQIWMVGFDPARAAAGQDPGFTAFWLPFQDAASGNHIAQWVENVDRQPCDDQECPGGEFCEGGFCVPDID